MVLHSQPSDCTVCMSNKGCAYGTRELMGTVHRGFVSIYVIVLPICLKYRDFFFDLVCLNCVVVIDLP